MGISVARKLQAFSELIGPFDFVVHRVALTPDQVREYGLPSTPLKPTEKRADKWRRATGTEQTEIDALASLRPDLLRRIARDAIKPYYDAGLARRVAAAHAEWLLGAMEIIDRDSDTEELARARDEAERQLDEMRGQIATINRSLSLDVDDFDLPEIVIPEAENGAEPPEPLISSDWSFARQCFALINSKRDYE